MNSQNESTLQTFFQIRRTNEISEATLKVDTQILRKLGNFLGEKTFREATKSDLVKFVSSLTPQRKGVYKPSTTHIYKRKLKLFYSWLYELNRGEYPTCIRWLNGSNPKSSKSGGLLDTLTPETVLTETEIMQLVKVAEDQKHKERDQALIMLTYETAARANEILNLRVGSIELKKTSGIAVLHGNDGSRRLPFVLSYPYIVRWLNLHPWRENLDSPLWLSSDKRYRDEPLKKEAIRYDKFRDLLKKLKKTAKIHKPCNPHSLRHARLTVLSKSLPEAKVKTFAGWKPDSRMVSTYVHLSGKDLDQDILNMYGKADKEESQVSPLLPKTCQRCEMENPSTAEYCQRCGLLLDAEKAAELGTKEQLNQQVIEELKKKNQDLLNKIEIEKKKRIELEKKMSDVLLSEMLQRQNRDLVFTLIKKRVSNVEDVKDPIFYVFDAPSHLLVDVKGYIDQNDNFIELEFRTVILKEKKQV